jgi:hypothetical protein
MIWRTQQHTHQSAYCYFSKLAFILKGFCWNISFIYSYCWRTVVWILWQFNHLRMHIALVIRSFHQPMANNSLWVVLTTICTYMYIRIYHANQICSFHLTTIRFSTIRRGESTKIRMLRYHFWVESIPYVWHWSYYCQC